MHHSSSAYFAPQNCDMGAVPKIGPSTLQVGGLASLGVVLFSGSCYAAALTENRSNGTFAPFGGFAFIFAWLALAL